MFINKHKSQKLFSKNHKIYYLIYFYFYFKYKHLVFVFSCLKFNKKSSRNPKILHILTIIMGGKNCLVTLNLETSNRKTESVLEYCDEAYGKTENSQIEINFENIALFDFTTTDTTNTANDKKKKKN